MNKQLVNFVTREHKRLVHRAHRAFHFLQPADLLLEHLVIEEQNGAQRLVLRGSRHSPIHRQISQEAPHLLSPQCLGMPISVETHEAPNPAEISLFGAQPVMSEAYHLTYPVQQARLCLVSVWFRMLPSHHLENGMRHWNAPRAVIAIAFLRCRS